jgi:hypothetical protein
LFQLFFNLNPIQIWFKKIEQKKIKNGALARAARVIKKMAIENLWLNFL